MSIHADLHDLPILERRDCLDLDEVIAKPPIRAFGTKPMQSDPVNDRTLKFTDITVDLKMAVGRELERAGRPEEPLQGSDIGRVSIWKAAMDVIGLHGILDIAPAQPLISGPGRRDPGVD